MGQISRRRHRSWSWIDIMKPGTGGKTRCNDHCRASCENLEGGLVTHGWTTTLLLLLTRRHMLSSAFTLQWRFGNGNPLICRNQEGGSFSPMVKCKSVQIVTYRFLLLEDFEREMEHLFLVLDNALLLNVGANFVQLRQTSMEYCCDATVTGFVRNKKPKLGGLFNVPSAHAEKKNPIIAREDLLPFKSLVLSSRWSLHKT